MSGPVVTIGESMALLRSHGVGSLAQAANLDLAIGGAESNVSIGLSRLGTPATWLGRVGRDGFGERIVRELRAEGVTVLETVDAEAATGLMVKEQRIPGRSRITYYRASSAGSRLTIDDIPRDVVESAALLHVTGITLALSESAADTVRTAVGWAVDAGVPVSFDINHRTRLWGDRDPRDDYLDMVRASSVVFASDDEARLIVEGETAGELAAGLGALGPTQAVVKLGERGCCALIDGVMHEYPALRIEPIDTVGAGDAFVAGYLAELLAGASPRERLRTAVTTGAFVCLHAGDWEGAPTRSELGYLDALDPVER